MYNMYHGWARFNSWEIFGRAICFDMRAAQSWRHRESWITQANHLFAQLCVTSEHSNYVLIRAVRFHSQTLSSLTPKPPRGYLFLCPPNHIQTGPTSFSLPDSFSFWSLDPTGDSRLTEEQAGNLGFPEIKWRLEYYGNYWDATSYEGLAAFHAAKGFDPTSQDLAIHLGLPLFELSSRGKELLARGDSQSVE
ncbi:hypothetical protein FB45DRAFT_798173 [Roridomyces roridus]|uniref:Uncharacterized protein n=1 Tax=Roridomyces roridus TaxID=1738132 RepID=A0AAD7BI37_9AGAR|nr:hypothetical protein FB45DRAFT_798173 [Roridomyces roridus]